MGNQSTHLQGNLLKKADKEIDSKPNNLAKQRAYRKTEQGKITTIYQSQKRSSQVRGMDSPYYTRSELENWLYGNGYQELYNQWKDSGYERGLSPSVDRLDDYKPYSLDNIQLVTWQENNKKAHQNRRDGISTQGDSFCRKIEQYDLYGKFLNSFNSHQIASKNLGINQSLISISVNNYGKTAKGFIFKNKGYEITKDELLISQKRTSAYKFVYRKNIKTLKIDKFFNLDQALKKTTNKLKKTTVQMAISKGSICGGYEWSYGGYNNVA